MKLSFWVKPVLLKIIQFDAVKICEKHLKAARCRRQMQIKCNFKI